MDDDKIIQDIISKLSNNDKYLLLYFLIKEKIRYVGLHNFYKFLDIILTNVRIEGEEK